MSKDFKEKYEKVCTIKDKALSLVEIQLNGDISSVDAKELGEVADIAKDMAAIMKSCAEAEYYFTVTEAMHESDDETKSKYLNKYIPEYEGKFYTPRRMYTRDPLWHDEYMPEYRDRMHYSTMDSKNSDHMYDDRYNGKAYMTRRMYMEHKDSVGSDVKMKDMEKYIKELSDDITEMLEGLTPTERQTVKQKVAGLAAAIV